ncbi:MAG: DODA-type extradiol aromatic ring-opening family dioxygenase [Rhodospirillales bacterium]
MNSTPDTARAPALFISHGAPAVLVDDGPARRFLVNHLAQMFSRPKAVLVISAHWATHIPALTAAAEMSTIHDFGGFAPELYEIKYPVKGAPELAEKAVALLRAAGLDAEADAARGLDHGAWIPLCLAYPERDIPVFQLSVQMRRTPQQHYEMGRALRPLRDEGVMIIGSGGITHNLSAVRAAQEDDAAPEWVTSFNDWVCGRLESGGGEALFDYIGAHPHGQANHPSPDHILPLFAAMGAGDDISAKRLHHSYTYSVLSMDCYALSDAA